MNELFIAILIISLLGLLVGILLSVSAKIFAVQKDEKEEQIRACLPGANCGACGFSGCDGYAKALAEGKAESVSLCAPGGSEVANALGALLGKTAEAGEEQVAVVACGGDCENAQTKIEYHGVQSCKLAVQLYDGQKVCVQGCLGYGDCVSACPYDAIFICNGVAKISPDKCKACRACIKVCPKGVISLMPKRKKSAVLCKNTDKGADARKACKKACIGCGKCERSCPQGAIKVENFLARVDASKCNACGICAEGCPVKCISIM